MLSVFWSRFLHRTTTMSCRNRFSMFFAFLIFDPKWPFCKVYSLCLVAIFANFQNALIFRILAVFSSRFFLRTTQCLVETFLAYFFAFLTFDPKWPFCKGYNLCLVVILANFQNGLISQILAVFSCRFLHRTAAMCCRNVFSKLFCIFNFWPRSDDFAKAIVLAQWPFLPIFKMVSFFEY